MEFLSSAWAEAKVAAEMKWAQARIGREERELMGPSLDERIGQEHGIRVLEGFLAAMDWSGWEASYERDGAGRPPIHPREMCGAILYGLIKRIRELDERLARDLERLAACEEGEQGSREELEEELRALEARRAKLEVALAEARRRDEIKCAKDGRNATAVRVPVGDPDSHIMPNKEGGYAPNYTPVVAAESRSGLVVAAGMAEGNAEAASVGELLEEAGGIAGEGIARVVFDGGFASGGNLQDLAAKGVEVYAACAGGDEGNPALRADGTKAVDEALRGRLPKRGGKLDRAAFLYDAATDCYDCPMGRRLGPHRRVRRKDAQGSPVEVMEYRCAECGGCPLAGECLSGRAKVRSVGRDEYQALRDELAERMKSAEARLIYARRAPVLEGVFATIKSTMGIRRFARRGMRKVSADWQWICAAFNLLKIMKAASKPGGPFVGPFEHLPALTHALGALLGRHPGFRHFRGGFARFHPLFFSIPEFGFVAQR